MRWISRLAAAAALSALSISLAGAPPALAQQVPAAPSPRFMVVLDAAHGGDEPGGRFNDGQVEKAVTLALSVRLRSLLAARGIQVVTTRESDANVEPARRAEIANHANAQACLSLHATEIGAGIHLYASSLAPRPLSMDRLEDRAGSLGHPQPRSGRRAQLDTAARRRQRHPGTHLAAHGR